MNLVYIICLLAQCFCRECLGSDHKQNEGYLRESQRSGGGVGIFGPQGVDVDAATSYQTWVLSLIASCVIGLSGVVPLILIPVETGLKLKQGGGGSRYLRLLLSFAVGGLLGDVFLHLLPEAWNHQMNLGSSRNSGLIKLGLSVLLGMFSFVVLEMIFTATQSDKMNAVPEKITKSSGSEEYYDKVSSNGKIVKSDAETSSGCYQRTALQNGHHTTKPSQNGAAHKLKTSSKTNEATTIHIAGYLNLMANCVDNFTHGLAVAASFLVSSKMGVLTTFAILIHEIPHEIGDFAILLKSGFHPWTAAKAQISTAAIGVLGVIVALSVESVDQVGVCTSLILPFTAGGFLNIALVNVLPDLLTEKDPWESMKQFVCLCAGIGVMACVSFLV